MILLVHFHIYFGLLLSKTAHLKGSSAKGQINRKLWGWGVWRLLWPLLAPDGLPFSKLNTPPSRLGLTSKDHTKYMKKKIAKNIALLFRSKPCLCKRYLLSLYYSCIHTHISQFNKAWGSTYILNLKKASTYN